MLMVLTGTVNWPPSAPPAASRHISLIANRTWLRTRTNGNREFEGNRLDFAHGGDVLPTEGGALVDVS